MAPWGGGEDPRKTKLSRSSGLAGEGVLGVGHQGSGVCWLSRTEMLWSHWANNRPPCGVQGVERRTSVEWRGDQWKPGPPGRWKAVEHTGFAWGGSRAGVAALGPSGWLWAGVQVFHIVAAAGGPSSGPGCRVTRLGVRLGGTLLGGLYWVSSHPHH